MACRRSGVQSPSTPLDFCQGGGTGIRAGLKNQWSHGREGSTPSLGTLERIEANSSATGPARVAGFEEVCGGEELPPLALFHCKPQLSSQLTILPALAI